MNRVAAAALLSLVLAACAQPMPPRGQDAPEFLAITEVHQAEFLPKSAPAVPAAGRPTIGSRGSRGDDVWYVHAGQNLSEILTSWGHLADRTVVWQTSHDWPIAVNGQFKGSFDDALAWVVAGVSDTSPRPHVQQFENASVRVLAEE
jgi:hypothetical protein